MSWRTVVVTSRAKLDLQMNSLVVRGDTTMKVHISEISVLIIESTAVSITAALLSELTKQKVKVIFCDEQRNPSSELIPYNGSHDCTIKIKMQISWTPTIKGELWSHIIREKIYGQRTLLKCTSNLAFEKLDNYMREITFNDGTNREGHAAKVYFNALFGMEFSRALDCPINASLNYGYSLFLSLVNREIVANGYLTQIGIFHDNMFNPFNLGSDLMEPFRPIVDELVYHMRPEKFEKEEKMQIVSLLSKTLIIDEAEHYITNVVKIYCKSIFDALNQGDLSLVRFFRK